MAQLKVDFKQNLINFFTSLPVPEDLNSDVTEITELLEQNDIIIQSTSQEKRKICEFLKLFSLHYPILINQQKVEKPFETLVDRLQLERELKKAIAYDQPTPGKHP